MKRYIRFGPPDIDSDSDNGNLQKNKSPKPKKKDSMSNAKFKKAVSSINEHLVVDTNPNWIVTTIANIKETYDLTPEQQVKFKSLLNDAAHMRE